MEKSTIKNIGYTIFFSIVFAINHAVRVTLFFRGPLVCIRHSIPKDVSQGSYLGTLGGLQK